MLEADPRPQSGVIARFAGPDQLLTACRALRAKGAQGWDTYTPFPIHGLEEAAGMRMTRLPILFFFAGIGGLVAAIAMQWWMNAVNYPYMISGKPFWSLPANIPVGFEVTVLAAGVTTFLATLVRLNLPSFQQPIHNLKTSLGITDDTFAIAGLGSVEAMEALGAHLKAVGGQDLEFQTFDASPESHRLPRAVIWGMAAVVVLGLLPVAYIYRARQSTSSKPRVHLQRNMDTQISRRAQEPSEIFADGRSSRLPPKGTVATSGDSGPRADSHFYRGEVDGAWAQTLPAQIPANLETLERGRARFEIYCSACHGFVGKGNGLVAQRASELKMSKWVPPTSIHAPHVQAQPMGRIFHTIGYGVRNMRGYGHAMPVGDRWAVALYLKALQRSQNATLADVPAEERARLK